MGCRHSKQTQQKIEHNGQLYNKDVDIRKKFLTGVHIAKGANGIEANIQIALGKTSRKKYKRVSPPPAVPREPADPAVPLESAEPEVPAVDDSDPLEPAVPSDPAVPSVPSVDN